MTRWRRFAWLAGILVLAALLVPAVAVAAPDSTAVQAPNSALSWTDIRDSDGVPLANYMFVTSDPSILKPLSTMLMLMLQLLFYVWSTFATLAIWLTGYALSFGWLDLFAEVLLGTANLFAGQVGTTIVLITAATLGAFFVSYFVARGYYAKATIQVVTMIAVAVFGVVFLARPLADVLGPDGLLAKGRDLGLSIAAGLFGNANPDPDSLVATMQASMADNFVRKPLQVWNFGHVIDDQCGAAWSSGMMSGDSNHVMSALRACDFDAYAAADEPGGWQLGVGLVLLVCGLVLVFFALRLGLRLIRAAMNAVYHGFMSILGFAAGGYIYGPTQTFLIRNLVDTVMSAFGMAAYTVFLALYLLVLGDVFLQARGQVMQVFVIGTIVMLLASSQMNALQASLESGGQWVANRFAAATTGGDAAGGGGVPGIGVGGGGTNGGLKLLAAVTAMNTLATAGSNPLMFGMYRTKWQESAAGWVYKWQENLANRRKYFDSLVKSILKRRDWTEGAPVNGRMLATLANDWVDFGLPAGELGSSLLNVLGEADPDIMEKAVRAIAAKSFINKNRPANAVPLSANAWVGVDNFYNRLFPDPGEDVRPEDILPSFEAAGRAIRDLNKNIPVVRTQLTNEGGQKVEEITKVLREQKSHQALYELSVARGGDGGAKSYWASMGPDARHTLAGRFANELRAAHHAARPYVEAFNRGELSAEQLRDIPEIRRLLDAGRAVQVLEQVPIATDTGKPNTFE